MPIIALLADLVGLTRQSTVLAFCYVDGFSKVLSPTNPELSSNKYLLYQYFYVNIYSVVVFTDIGTKAQKAVTALWNNVGFYSICAGICISMSNKHLELFYGF
jgi:hypothetical protein